LGEKGERKENDWSRVKGKKVWRTSAWSRSTKCRAFSITDQAPSSLPRQGFRSSDTLGWTGDGTGDVRLGHFAGAAPDEVYQGLAMSQRSRVRIRHLGSSGSHVAQGTGSGKLDSGRPAHSPSGSRPNWGRRCSRAQCCSQPAAGCGTGGDWWRASASRTGCRHQLWG
jgi:hypothetical protein